MKLVWLKLAQIDLEKIMEYYTKEAGSAVTNKLLKKIVTSARLIKENPFIGNKTYQDDLMEWHIPNIPFTLPYRLKNNQIQILRVFHQSQNKPDYWD